MQINPELISALAGVISSILGSAIGYGVLKTKVHRLERDMEEFEKKFVSTELFNALMSQVKDDLHDLKSSMKELLSLVHNRDK